MVVIRAEEVRIGRFWICFEERVDRIFQQLKQRYVRESAESRVTVVWGLTNVVSAPAY